VCKLGTRIYCEHYEHGALPGDFVVEMLRDAHRDLADILLATFEAAGASMEHGDRVHALTRGGIAILAKLEPHLDALAAILATVARSGNAARDPEPAGQPSASGFKEAMAFIARLREGAERAPQPFPWLRTGKDA